MRILIYFFILICLCCFCKGIVAQSEKINTPLLQNASVHVQTIVTHHDGIEEESPIAVKFKNLEGKRHLLLGLKKNEGTIGSTFIINSNGNVIFKKENFEMAIFPAYNAIDVSHYSTGTYKARIVSEKKITYEVSVVINDD